ncbi:MAG: hypothetical protein ABR582_16780 [Gemmatimonadaceae bacterium]
MAALFFVPLAYLAVVLTLLARKSWAGIATSVVFAALAVATAIWAILQSRSSTAGIGFIGIPFLAGGAGLLGLAFGRWRSSTALPRRVAAWASLAIAVLAIVVNLREGATTRDKNAARDAYQEGYSAEIARAKQAIAAGIAQNKARQGAYIDSSIRARIKDNPFLIAALENDSISPDLLDTIASSNDLNVAYQAVRNPNARGETLVRVYRTKPYPDYFFSAIAAHPHAPPEILRELYKRRAAIGGLETEFAVNPSTPREILDELSRTSKEEWVFHQLLRNPALDCGLVRQAIASLVAMHRLEADADAQQARDLEAKLCA